VIERSGRIWRESDLGYADTLRKLTPGTVSSTTERTGAGIRIELDTGAIVVHPKLEEVYVHWWRRATVTAAGAVTFYDDTGAMFLVENGTGCSARRASTRKAMVDKSEAEIVEYAKKVQGHEHARKWQPVDNAKMMINQPAPDGYCTGCAHRINNESARYPHGAHRFIDSEVAIVRELT
jgi:hypothetical protein